MKKLLTILLVLISFSTFAQFEAGEYINSDTVKKNGVNLYLEHLKMNPQNNGKIARQQENSVVWGKELDSVYLEETDTSGILDKDNFFWSANKKYELITPHIGGGTGDNVYMTNVNSDISGYKKTSYTNDTGITSFSATVSADTVLVQQFLFDGQLATSILDAGEWVVETYCKVSSIAGVSKFKYEFFVYDDADSTIFSFYSDEINNTAFQYNTYTSFQSAFNLGKSTYRLGVRVYFLTTLGAPITGTFRVGDGETSYINTPIALRHVRIRNPNEDPNVQHMTADDQNAINRYKIDSASYLTSEVDGSINNEIQDLSRTGNTLSLSGDGTTVDLSDLVNPSLTGYRLKTDHDSLSALDERSYNSLTDKPTSLPASDVYPWAKAATKPTYTKSEVGLGNVDNTSDASKPISTATQTALNNLVPFLGADRDVDLGANSISTDTVKIDGAPLLLNAFKKDSLGGAGQIPYSNGASSQLEWGTVNQVIGNNYIQNQNSAAQSANMWIGGSLISSSGFPFISKLPSFKTWTFHRSGNNLFLAPSATIDDFDWDWPKQTIFNGDGTVIFASTIQATTAKLTNLTDGYLPLHQNDANGLVNSNIYQDGSGNVGIGTTGPIAKLHSAIASNGTGLLLENTVGGGSYVDLAASPYPSQYWTVEAPGAIRFTDAGNYSSNIDFMTKSTSPNGTLSSKMTILTGGNVGVNKTDPTEKLDVNGNLIADVLKSRIPTGTPPLVVASSTKVDNLNVSFLEGHPASYFETANVNIQRHITNDNDTIIDNEIQDLSRAGNTLSLSGDGTTVDLSDLVNPDLSGYATTTQLADQLSQTITNGVTTKAPSEDAVYDALAGKASVSGTDNYIMKKTGTNTLGNSLIRESGDSVILDRNYLKFSESLLFETANREFTFSKLTGSTALAANRLFRFQTVGGVDSINPYWNGLQLMGHPIISYLGATNYPIMGTYSRSTTANNPTDYEFITAVGNTSNNIGLSYYAPYISGSSVNFGFGSTKKALAIKYDGTNMFVRLGYDANKYTDLTTGSTGNLTIDPTGDTVKVVGAVNSTGGFFKNGVEITGGSGGGMVYPGAGIPVSTGSAWGTSIADNSTNWTSGYNYRLIAAGATAPLYLSLSGNVLSGHLSPQLTSIGTLANSAGLLYNNGAGSFSYKTAPSGAIVGTTDSQALTNKSVNGVTLSTSAGATNFLAGDGTYKAVSGTSKWTADTYGINYQSGNVGIGTASHSTSKLYVNGSITNNGSDRAALDLVWSNGESTIVSYNTGGGDGLYANSNGVGVRGISSTTFGGVFEGLGVQATKYYVSSLNTAPASSTATGTTGEIRFTADYIYVCVATNTWKRTQISTW